MDLNSNLADKSLTNRDQLNKLNIEKQVELKQTKTNVPRKQIRKYQNDPYSNKQLRDLGGCEKKVRDDPNDRNGDNNDGKGYRIGSYNDPENGDNGDNRDNGDNGDNGNNRNNGNNGNNRDRGYGDGGQRGGRDRNRDGDVDGENEPGYKVMRDNSYYKNPAKKEAIFVPINRRTTDPRNQGMVDTKLNGDNRRDRQREYPNEESEENYDKKDRSRVYPYDGNRNNNNYPEDDERDRERER